MIILEQLKTIFEKSNIYRNMYEKDFRTEINLYDDNSEKLIFRELMESVTCSDWNKTTIDGECYGGYWQSENLEEKNNAYDLTYEDNFKYIYNLLDKELYYPLTILWIIKYLCAYRCEAPVQIYNFYEFFLNNIVRPNYQVLMNLHHEI